MSCLRLFSCARKRSFSHSTQVQQTLHGIPINSTIVHDEISLDGELQMYLPTLERALNGRIAQLAFVGARNSGVRQMPQFKYRIPIPHGGFYRHLPSARDIDLRLLPRCTRSDTYGYEQQ